MGALANEVGSKRVESDELARRRRARGGRLRALRRRRLPRMPATSRRAPASSRSSRGSGPARRRSPACGPRRARPRSTRIASSRRCPTGRSRRRSASPSLSEMLASTAMGGLGLVPLARPRAGLGAHVFVDEWLTAARVAVGRRSRRCGAAPGRRACGARLGARRRARAARGRRAPDARAALRPLRGRVGPRPRPPRRHRRRLRKEGVRAAISIAGARHGPAGPSARAFLRGCYRLEGQRRRARAAAASLRRRAVVATLVGAVLATRIRRSILVVGVARVSRRRKTMSRGASRWQAAQAARARPRPPPRRCPRPRSARRRAFFSITKRPAARSPLAGPLDRLLDELRAVGHLAAELCPAGPRRLVRPDDGRRTVPRAPARETGRRPSIMCARKSGRHRRGRRRGGVGRRGARHVAAARGGETPTGPGFDGRRTRTHAPTTPRRAQRSEGDAGLEARGSTACLAVDRRGRVLGARIVEVHRELRRPGRAPRSGSRGPTMPRQRWMRAFSKAVRLLKSFGVAGPSFGLRAVGQGLVRVEQTGVPS